MKNEHLYHALHLVNGIEENTPICRYTELDYLLQMLEEETYRISRKETFEDECEGTFPINRVIPVNAVGEHVPPQPKQNADECLRIWRSIQRNRYVPTACWTLNMSGRLSMWKMFTSKYGVCIKSNVHDVVASVKNNDYDIWCGKMTYDGYSAQKGFMANMFSKRSSYSEEQECRFYLFESNETDNQIPFIKVPIMPKIMINEVFLSPLIAPATAKLLADMLQATYKIKATISNI